MKKAQVQVGKSYLAKVSNKLTVVTLIEESVYGGWNARNEMTGREVRVKSAQKLRKLAERIPGTSNKWKLSTVPSVEKQVQELGI
jgi:hypothetical protein